MPVPDGVTPTDRSADGALARDRPDRWPVHGRDPVCDSDHPVS